MNLRFTRALRPGLVLAGAAALGGCVVAPIGPREPRPVVRSVAPPPAPPPAAATPLYFYPQRGQAEAQQERDRYDCYRWAVHQTGSDPGMTPVRADDPVHAPLRVATPQRADGGDVLAGAATGALLGAAVSSPRHAGGHAVIGAIFGAAIGAAAGEARNRAIDEAQARRDHALARREAAWAQRARPADNNFRRAMSACMQGRGYQVQ